MANLAGTLTFLTLAGLSGPEAYIPQGETLAVRPTNLAFTEPGLYGCPKFIASEFTAKATAPQQDWVLSDTAYLSLTESPLDANEIVTYDTLSLRFSSESASLLNYYGVTETLRLSVGESVSLVTAGIFAKAGTDTLSLAATDTAAISATLEVSDTLSLSLTESAPTIDTTAITVDVTDTLSLSLDDAASIEQFSGFDPVVVGEILGLAITDSAVATPSRKVASIAISYKSPKIVVRKL